MNGWTAFHIYMQMSAKLRDGDNRARARARGVTGRTSPAATHATVPTSVTFENAAVD